MMKSIVTTATVSTDRTLTVTVPVDLEPGEHQVVLVVEDQPISEETLAPLKLPTLKVGPWPENLSLRREDMYDDWGR